MTPPGKLLAACRDAYALAEALAKLCKDPHPEKDGWRAACPCHNGKSDSSLSIIPTNDRVLVKCFAECDTSDILKTLGLTMADLFVREQKPGAEKRQVVRTYDYHDIHGKLIHQTVRFEPKSFRQRRPDPVHPGEWIWDLKGIEPLLYHLPQITKAIEQGETVYIVEGEKDAEALNAMGLAATCNPMGAKKWRPEYSETLRKAHVVILPDYDTPGQQHATIIAQALIGIAASVKIVKDLHTNESGSDIADWLRAGGTKEEFHAFVDAAPPYEPAPNEAPLGWSVGNVNGQVITQGMVHAAWRKGLFAKKNGELTQNLFNLTAILTNHEYWLDPDHALWWDSVRGTPMMGKEEITDHLLIDIATWLGLHERLPITSPRLLEQAIIAQCKKNPRDLLALWLNSLPAWDGTPRLTTWLIDVAGITLSDYVADVSRILVVSMVARALEPGCHYRYVVIFEGPENIGKSSLARALASPEWFVELSIGLETKEAHMMLQGAWVAELADLDSMSRTEDTRMKAFITMRQDSYIPKYSNFRQRTERRAIFIGTTNDDTYLKGLTGNTRYLPIRLEQQIDVNQFEAMRDQLFAEAIHYYQGHRESWWLFSDEAMATAKEEREQRRVMQVYEHPLHEWLEFGRFKEPIYVDGDAVKFMQDETSWPEIARHFLKLDSPEKWKDRSLQMQIAASLKGLGWEVKQVWKDGRNANIWRKPTPPPF